MLNDPRIKRILKRYPKGEKVADASMDITALGDSELLTACRSENEDGLTSPRELDEYALDHLSGIMSIDLDRGEFDYFLHSYVRSECSEAYFSDPLVNSKCAPENGPPAKIPLPNGMRWRSVRPKDGKEHYEAWEFAETD